PYPRHHYVSFYAPCPSPDRHSFPTRRSSDLLFANLLATGGPEQKTIVFCARDRHADDVAIALNNLYARWCRENGRPRLEANAFKDRKSTRLNSSHQIISYAVFCLKKKKKHKK